MQLFDWIMNDLEQARRSKRLTIKELTKGITSERMYRRYIRGESRLPSDIYMALMGKLGMDMIQYTLELNERIQTSHVKEARLVQLIKEEQFLEAEKLYQTLSHDRFYSQDRYRFLPILVLYMKLKLKRISKKEYMTQANIILDYPNIMNYIVLTRCDIEALLVHLLVVEDDEKDRISRFLLRVLEGDSIRMISHEPDITRSDILNVVPFALLQKTSQSQEDIQLIKRLLQRFGTYYNPYLELFRIGIHIRNLIAYHTITKEEDKLQMDVFHLFVYIFSHSSMTPYLEWLFDSFQDYYPAFLTFLDSKETVTDMVTSNWGDLV